MTPRTPGRLLASAPRTVWLLVVLYALVLACWSVLTPIFHAPDEPNHAEAVMRLVTGQGWGRPGHLHVGKEGQQAIADSPFGSRAQPYSLDPNPIAAGDAVARSARPDWKDLPVPGRRYSTTTIQQTTQHPPGYYAVAAAAVRLTGGASQPWDRAVGVMRLVSVVLVAPLPLLAWATAVRITDRPAAGLAAAVVPFAIPQLTHIGGAVNNDNALSLTAGLVTVGVACVLRGDRSIRTALFVGGTLGLALLTKSLALVFVPLVPVAYLVPWAYARRGLLEDGGDQHSDGRAVAALRPALLALVVAFAVGGWWYAVNMLRYGAVQPPVPGFAPGTFLGTHWHRLVDAATNVLLQRYWGSAGLFEVNLPFALVWLAGLVVAGLIVAALLRARRPSGRLNLLLLLWPTLGTYVLIVAEAVKYYLHTHYTGGLQGRYLFLGVVGAAAVIGAGATDFRHPGATAANPNDRPDRSRSSAALVLLVAAFALQLVTVRLALRHWWEPTGVGLHGAWGGILAWSPWPSTALRVLPLLTAVAAVVTVAALLRGDRDPAERPPADRINGERVRSALIRGGRIRRRGTSARPGAHRDSPTRPAADGDPPGDLISIALDPPHAGERAGTEGVGGR